VLPIVVDTETTGLGQAAEREDAIVEVAFAWRDPASGAVRTWARLCNPGERHLAGGRADRALGISQIRIEDVRAAPDAREVAVEMRRELRALARAPGATLLAYNVAFDAPFLAQAPWHLHGPWGPCLKLAAHRALDPGGKWPRLLEACRMLGIAYPGAAHRAVHDAHAALLVHEALQARATAAPTA
jgi:DNA polymerase III epsilon subunit-like protein